MACVYLLLGTNVGNKPENILLAKKKLKQKGVSTIQESSVYETSPWGFKCSENFHNQIISINTTLLPIELLSLIHYIENDMGRKRSSNTYEPRIIDIDILFYDTDVIDTKDLKIPHPRLHLRKFTLIPLCEIIPYFEHPVLKKTIKQLCDECQDDGDVRKLI